MVLHTMRGAAIETLPGERMRPPGAYVPPCPPNMGKSLNALFIRSLFIWGKSRANLCAFVQILEPPN